MKTPHVHAALIKAWADGAIIQYYSETLYQEWRDADKNSPIWDENEKYRVKPNKVTYWFGVIRTKHGGIVNLTCHKTKEDAEYTLKTVVQAGIGRDGLGVFSFEVEE